VSCPVRPVRDTGQSGQMSGLSVRRLESEMKRDNCRAPLVSRAQGTDRTIRNWCDRHRVGRRAMAGGPWEASRWPYRCYVTSQRETTGPLKRSVAVPYWRSALSSLGIRGLDVPGDHTRLGA
jgi:hypothetical protein